MENQFGQLASALINKSPRKFLSDTQVLSLENGKECKAVPLKVEKSCLTLIQPPKLEVKNKIEAKTWKKMKMDG